MEDNLNGRQPQWKTTPMEDDLNGKGKNTSMEEYLDGSRPQWKSYRKQMTLACLTRQFCTELGPGQPQLVIVLNCLTRLDYSNYIFVPPG